MKTILFQGDSITDSNRNRAFDDNRGNGYATLVSAHLGMERPGEFCFLNRGISGDRAIDVLARAKADIFKLKPDYLSILIGTNDVWRKYQSDTAMDIKWYKHYYELLIQQIQEALPNVKIMIMEPYLLKGQATETNWEDFRKNMEEHAAAARELAQRHNFVFVPLMDRFDEAAKLAPVSYWLYDGVHPTAMGHEIIKRAWLEGFQKLEQQNTV